MLKWILGILLFLVLAVVGTCYYGYRQLTSEGRAASVLVATTPDRVWHHLTMPDSIRSWQESTTVVTFSTDSSTLTVGDTMWLETRERAPTGASRRMTWVLEQMEIPRVLVWAARDDSTRMEFVRRTDSIVPQGTVLRLVSVIDAPSFDAMAASDSVRGLGGAMMRGVGRVAVGAMRLMAQQDLDNLKGRLEQP
jgi:uncharacterized protein YndB with AHSA1/START domain